MKKSPPELNSEEEKPISEQVNAKDIQIITSSVRKQHGAEFLTYICLLFIKEQEAQTPDNIDDLNILLNSEDQIDFNNISIENFQKLVREETRKRKRKKLIDFR